jgi:heat shock protein HtpX|tara:strand:- start:2723 stop:3565 length:843 start_codon:yes stop_codon:yes gene_type:complete
MFNQLKTAVLLGALGGVLLMIGGLFGGQQGLIIALVFALVLNFGAYWFSDKVVLRIYRARELSVSEHPRVHQIVNTIAKKAGLPKPKLYLIPSKNPNAFATGRNPSNAAVGVTEGILDILNEKELRGVLAHEMSHIKNRDILIGSVAATIATTISFLATMAQWSAIFGMGRNRSGSNIIGLLAVAIVTPMIAAVIQMAISRSREFMADDLGAKLIKDGKSLASALKKLESHSKSFPMRFGNDASAHMFIVHPFSGRNAMKLLSTHPSTAERVKRLEKMRF